MSPLWSDSALAKAAWTNAVASGLIDSSSSAKDSGEIARIRRVPRPRLHSFAL